MKTILYNKEQKFAFINSKEIETLDILKLMNWKLCIIDDNDNQDIIQLKINSLLKIK